MALVFIFAHPDDEAYGPAATLAKFAQKEDVYLICVTNGNDKTRNYEDPNYKNGGLISTREKELEESSKVLGIKKVFFLGYEDGELRNSIYHEVALNIRKILEDLKPDKLMTFEPRGLTGHIDHVFVAMVTSFVFEKLDSAKKLYYYCMSEEERKEIGDYFIYFPPGYSKREVDKVENVKGFWDKKCAAIMCHKSQLQNPEETMDWLNKTPQKDHFLVKVK